MRSKIAGTGHAVPGRIRTNDDLAKMIDTSDAWITERTGIRARRILEDGRATSDLAAEAALKACKAAGVAPSELDCIVCCTVTPDSPLPASAVLVQQKIGAKCPAFDLAAACAGFIYGLTVADAFVRAGNFKKVLVIGVEVLSRCVDWQDRNTCVIFGDGAGAAVVTPATGDEGIYSTHIFADGALASILNIPAGGTSEPPTHDTVEKKRHFVYMQGRQVFTHAVRHISAACQAALAQNHLGPADVDWVVAHQANLRILEAVSERTQVPMSKFFLNIDKYGNTSSASIPIALDEAIAAGKIKRGQRLLLTGLGAGLSWGAALLRW